MSKKIIVKIAFLLGLSVIQGTSWAQQNLNATGGLGPADGDNESSDVMNLNYYPHAGKWRMLLDYSTYDTDDTYTSNGTASSYQGSSVDLNFAYGLENGWRIGISQGDLLNSTDVSTNNRSVTTSTSASGLGNPSITGAWRFLENPYSGLSGDLILTVSPSYSPRVVATTSQSGNNMSGGWSESLAASLFWRAGLNELEGGAEIFNVGPNSQESTAASGSAVVSNYQYEALALYDRVHFGSNWFLQGELSLTNAYNEDITSGTGVGRTLNIPSFVNPTFSIGYRAQHSLVLELASTVHNSTTHTSQATGVTTYSSNNQREDEFRLLYEF